MAGTIDGAGVSHDHQTNPRLSRPPALRAGKGACVEGREAADGFEADVDDAFEEVDDVVRFVMLAAPAVGYAGLGFLDTRLTHVLLALSQGSAYHLTKPRTTHHEQPHT